MSTQEGKDEEEEPREDGGTISLLRATWDGGLREALPEPERPRSAPASDLVRPPHRSEAGYGAWARRRFWTRDELLDRLAGEGDDADRTSPRPPPEEFRRLPTIRGSTDDERPPQPSLRPAPGAGADGARRAAPRRRSSSDAEPDPDPG